MKYYRSLHNLLCAMAILVICTACSADPMTIREAKSALPNGSSVAFSELSVTATFTGSIYAENTDRSQGIRVDTARTFAEGDLVNVSGTIETDIATGERYVASSTGYPQATGDILVLKPVMINSRELIGGDSGLQQGIADDSGLNTIGMLVTTWGPVSALDPASPRCWFKVSDSYGPEVKVVVPSGTTIDKDWGFVTVTGICSVERVDGVMTRVIKARRTSDIASHTSWAEAKVKTMTVDEKIGQLFQIRVSGSALTSADSLTIQQKHIGGVIYFQTTGNLDDPVMAAHFSNDLQACAIGVNGTGIPLLISMDQEGGRVTRITGGADFPGNMALGAARSADMAYLAGNTMGTEIRAVGANMDLAPVLDVNNNPLNPVIGVRSFGEQAGLVSDMGLAYIDGLDAAGVIATGKHFPGHGDTAVDSHSGLPIVTYDFTTLDTVHGKPFRDAVANGLQAIMSAHIVVTCLDATRPATLSPAVMDGYLRGNLGFDGVIMTDSMGMAGITSGYGVAQSSVMAIQAGVDLLSLSPDLDTAISAITSAVLSGEIPQSRLDQSVARILRLKYRNGLFENPYVNEAAAAGIVGCADHWNAELSAARAGITLVQNTSGILPLNLTSGQKILLVTVQSSTETVADAAARFASCISAKHSNVQSLALAVNPTSAQRNTVKTAAASAYVTIIGTSRAQLSSNVGQATLVNELRAAGRTVIVVGLREPYELASFPTANAYVAAYNYRDCGFQAAADVIFDDVNPSGLLPVTIPGLYAYGWGLSYPP